MEVQVDQQQGEINQPSQVEGAEAGGEEGHQHTPAQPAATTPPAAKAPEKSMLDKIREKGSVAPPAVKASEVAAAQEKAAIEAFKANHKFKAAGVVRYSSFGASGDGKTDDVDALAATHAFANIHGLPVKADDVPELLRGLMTDAEKEKYVHSLLSKAHGIEMVQEKLKGVRESRDQIHQAYTQVMEPIQLGQQAFKRGDMDTVFSTLRIDPNKVLQWAYEKVQLSQMPPEQRQLHEAKAKAERENWDLQRQQASMSQQSMETQADQIDQMIGMVLERQDFQSIAQDYDTRKGKQGAFHELVALMGDQEFQRTGKLISPLDAAKAAVDLLGMKVGAPAAQPAAAAAPQPAAQPAAAPQAQPKITLPNAGGAKASAPAKSKPKSIDDLRKIHQQMASASK